ncbi:hypothetical protein ACPA9J_08685 [Pseudomonas aeruginosa]
MRRSAATRPRSGGSVAMPMFSACLRDRRFSADPARLGAAGVRQGGASWFGHQQPQPLARFYDNFMLFQRRAAAHPPARLPAPSPRRRAVPLGRRIEVLVRELDSLLERREPDLLRISPNR